MNPDVNARRARVTSRRSASRCSPGASSPSKDVTGAPRVAIINETMAKYYFGSGNPLGRHIGWGRDKTPDIEIVGVARDSKTSTLRQRAQARSSTCRTCRRTRSGR